MYQALYRKWRPQTFDAVIGQEHITETLKNQVRNNRLSHAYIFIGTRGTGKTTCARILAKAVNCEYPVNGNPCCQCDACRSITEGTAVDIVELDAASNNGVDNVRALREEAIFSPTTVKKRVYIIDEVHMLSVSAFNALLKILEEPPEHLMFILATTELQKVPATILSRCQRHSFKRLDAEKLATYLQFIGQQESFRITPDAANLIARLSDGGVRDSLSLLDQCSGSGDIDVEAVYSTLGLAGNRRTAQLLECILNHDTEEAVNSFNSLWMDGKDPSTILSELCTLLRDILISQVAPKSFGSLVSGTFDRSVLGQYRTRMTSEELTAGMDTIQNTLYELKNAPNPKMSAEICLISLCGSVMGDSIRELKARISRLEEQVRNGIVARNMNRSVPAVEDEPETSEEFPEEEEYPPFPEEEYAPPAVNAPRPAPKYTEEPSRPAEEPAPAQIAPLPPTVPVPKETEASEREEPAVPAASVPSSEHAPNSRELWKKVREEGLKSLPKPLAMLLDNENEVTGYYDGTVFHIEAVQGFILTMMSKQTTVRMFEQLVQQILGKPARVSVTELVPQKHETRSLEELKQFKEVQFY